AEVFSGGYSAYAAEVRAREERTWDAWERQQREERRMKQVISTIESRARTIEQSTIDFAIRKKAAKISRRQVTLKARMEREAASASHIDRPLKPSAGFEGVFGGVAGGAMVVAECRELSLEQGGAPLLRGVSFSVQRSERVALLGPNGSGKTTLLRAFLGEHAPAAGEVRLAPSARAAFLAQEEALPADQRRTPIDLIREAKAMPEAEAFNTLHRFHLRHDRARAPIGTLSYGERRRLELARLVLGGAGLLLLDEPTNHLDIPSREAFEQALEAFGGAVILVTHDRYLVERFATRILEIVDGTVREV
ncbi:MAG TPA: ATP-binding cassette domain-containing protein, partial [Tepidiformaceae bacterium]|nr:ATP-binding cassette domain-containing protein [Tepidiformaceae bacterium]